MHTWEQSGCDSSLGDCGIECKLGTIRIILLQLSYCEHTIHTDVRSGSTQWLC